VTDKLVGDADRVKLAAAAAFTVSVTVVDAVKLPCVPLMVTVAVPVVAVELAVSVKVLGEPLATLVGLKAAETPLGKPEAARLALPVNPLSAVSEIELVPPAPPCVIVTLAGEAASVKLGDAEEFTVSETVVMAVKLPCVPVIVTVAVPIVAVELAVSVKVLGEPLATLVGLKAAVTPVGKPEAASEALPVKPFSAVNEIALVPPAPPCVIVTLPGDAARVKLGFCVVAGQLFTRFAALTVPMPVAKSQPVALPYAGA